MSISPYLVRRGTRFYFRMRVPAEVVTILGRSELKRSLFTSDVKVARRRARRLVGSALILIEKARKRPVTSEEYPEITEDMIRQLAQCFYKNRLEEYRVRRVHFREVPELVEEQKWLVENRSAELKRLRKAFNEGDFSAIETEALFMLDGLGIRSLDDADWNEVGFRELCDAFMAAGIEALERMVERDAGNWDGQPSHPILKPVPCAAKPAAPSSSEGVPVPDIASNEAGRYSDFANDDAALEAQKRAAMKPLEYVELFIQERTDIDVATAKKYRQVMREFEAMCGAKPMTEYRDHHVTFFKNQLLKAPSHATTALGYESIAAAVADANTWVKSKKRMDASTINGGYLSYVREMFSHAANDGVIERAIGTRVKVRTTGSRNKKRQNARLAFSAQALKKVFEQPLFLGAKSPNRLFQPGPHLDDSWRFWLPLFMLYAGVRPEELGQAEVSDIIERFGHPCLKVTTVTDPEDIYLCDEIEVERGKKVKTVAGEREIPLHPVLLDLGFMDVVGAAKRARERRIFWAWKKTKNRYSETSSKFFNRKDKDRVGFLVHAGVKTPKTPLYSMRHNFKQLLQHWGVPEGEQDYLMGHVTAGSGAFYESREAQRQLIARVKSLEYEELDLTPMFNARGRARSKAETDIEEVEKKIVVLTSRG